MQTLIEKNLHSSLRRLSVRTDVFFRSVRRILKNRLHMHPYKITLVQEILLLDHNSRMQYCNFFQENLNNDDVFDLRFFSNEAWFYLSGYIIKQNYRIWSVVNSHNFIEDLLHPVKIGIWLAIITLKNNWANIFSQYLPLMGNVTSNNCCSIFKTGASRGIWKWFLPTKWSYSSYYLRKFRICWRVFPWPSCEQRYLASQVPRSYSTSPLYIFIHQRPGL